MATAPSSSPQTPPQPEGVSGLEAVLAAGTVAAGALAPVAAAGATDAAVLAAVKKAAEALAASSSSAGDHAAHLVMDALPDDAPERRAATTALMRTRSRQFKVNSVKRVMRGARAALQEPTKKQVIERIRRQITRTPPAQSKRLAALRAALKAAMAEPSPRMSKMRAVIQKEGHYAALHALAQVGRANGSAAQAMLEVVSPNGARWVTAQDDRVTPDCAALDGKAIPHSTLRVWHPPLHARCRCELRAIGPDDDVLSHGEARNLLKHALTLHEADTMMALLVLGEVNLQEAAGGLLDWDPSRHPRGTRGRFRETLADRIKRGLPGMRLPDGTTIKPRPDGKIAVTSSGKIIKHDTVVAAVDDALNRSARKKHLDSVGGERSFKGFDDAVKDPGTPFEADGARPWTGTDPSRTLPEKADLGVPSEGDIATGNARIFADQKTGHQEDALTVLEAIRKREITAESFPMPEGEPELPHSRRADSGYGTKYLTTPEDEANYHAAEAWARKLPDEQLIAKGFWERSGDAGDAARNELDRRYPADGETPALGKTVKEGGDRFYYDWWPREKGKLAAASGEGLLVNPEWKRLAEDPSEPGSQASGALSWARERGIDLKEHASEETAAVRKLLDPKTAQITVRVNQKGLNGILTSKRFKTQHETGRSSAFLGRDTRAGQEQNLFGFPESGDATKRPVFGYVAEADEPIFRESGFLNQYGDVRVVLKNDVRARTTVTSDDSLDGTGAGVRPTMQAMPIDDADWRIGRYLDSSMAFPATRGREKGLNATGSFLEAQVHGGVGVDDIQEFILNRDPDEKLRKKLDKSGIPWRVQDEQKLRQLSVFTSRQRAYEGYIRSYEDQIQRAKTGKLSEYEKRTPEEVIKDYEAKIPGALKSLEDAKQAEAEYGKLYDQGMLLPLSDPQLLSNEKLRNAMIEAAIMNTFTNTKAAGLYHVLSDEASTRGSGRDGTGVAFPGDTWAARSKWEMAIRAGVNNLRDQGYGDVPEYGSADWVAKAKYGGPDGAYILKPGYGV